MAVGLEKLRSGVEEMRDKQDLITQNIEEEAQASQMEGSLKLAQLDRAVEKQTADLSRKTEQRKKTLDIQKKASQEITKIHNEIDYKGLALDVGVGAANAFASIYRSTQANNAAKANIKISKEDSDALANISKLPFDQQAQALRDYREERKQRIKGIRDGIRLPKSSLDQWQGRIENNFESIFRKEMRHVGKRVEKARENILQDKSNEVYNKVYDSKATPDSIQETLDEAIAPFVEMITNDLESEDSKRSPDSLKEIKDERINKVKGLLAKQIMQAHVDKAVSTGSWGRLKALRNLPDDQKKYVTPQMRRSIESAWKSKITTNKSANYAPVMRGLKSMDKRPRSMALYAEAKETRDPKALAFVAGMHSYMDELTTLKNEGQQVEFDTEDIKGIFLNTFTEGGTKRLSPDQLRFYEDLQDNVLPKMQAEYERDRLGYLQKMAPNSVKNEMQKWDANTSLIRTGQIATRDEIVKHSKEIVNIVNAAASDPAGGQAWKDSIVRLHSTYGDKTPTFLSQLRSHWEEDKVDVKERQLGEIFIQSALLGPQGIHHRDFVQAVNGIKTDAADKLDSMGIKPSTITSQMAIGSIAPSGGDEGIYNVHEQALFYRTYQRLLAAGTGDPTKKQQIVTKAVKEHNELVKMMGGRDLPTNLGSYGPNDTPLVLADWQLKGLEDRKPGALQNVQSALTNLTDERFVLNFVPISDDARKQIESGEGTIVAQKVKGSQSGEYGFYLQSTDGRSDLLPLTLDDTDKPLTLRLDQMAFMPAPFWSKAKAGYEQESVVKRTFRGTTFETKHKGIEAAYLKDWWRGNTNSIDGVETTADLEKWFASNEERLKEQEKKRKEIRERIDKNRMLYNRAAKKRGLPTIMDREGNYDWGRAL